VVEGRGVRRAGNRVLRVSVTVIDALTDRHIWAGIMIGRYSLALQGQLATRSQPGSAATLRSTGRARARSNLLIIPTPPTMPICVARGTSSGSPFDKGQVGATIQSYQEQAGGRIPRRRNAIPARLAADK